MRVFLFKWMLGLIAIVLGAWVHADILEKADIPKPLHAFYQNYVLGFHSHSSSPEVYKAVCFEGRYPDCIIMWAEILPSNSDVHVSIVAPNASESRISIPTGDNEFILGVKPVDGILLLSLIDSGFEESKWQTTVTLYKIKGDDMTFISKTVVDTNAQPKVSNE